MRFPVVELRDMTRLAAAWCCLLLGFGLVGCGSSPWDDRGGPALERAAFLFQNYSTATAKQDVQMIGILRGDLRRLCTDSFAQLLASLASRDQEVQGYAAFTLGFSGN